jgi:nucleoside-diphosphate-sugar epimerase
MSTYLVTGGTGLIGSNVCRLLVEQGHTVRALVRPGSDSEPLAAIGTRLVEGDIRSRDDVVRAAEGCEVVINSAALLGGAAQDRDASQATNVDGSLHAYDAGAVHGIRVVTLSSTPFLDHRQTLTEDSPVAEHWSDDPYTQTKGAAYVEAKRRVAEEGADIAIVIPGGTFGPGVVLSRAMSATSYDRVIRGAVNGKIAEYVTYPVPWVFAEDVAAACLAAATRGVAGRTYLAFGAEDARSTAAWLNVALEVAGVDHRVAEVTIEPGDPAAVARYGETLVDLARRRFPVPWFDNSRTRAELGYEPRPLREAMELTIPWLRENGQIV